MAVKSRVLTAISGLCVFLWTQNVIAQERWYRVDVVVFSQADFPAQRENIQNEQLPREVDLNWPDNLIELNSLEREQALLDELAASDANETTSNSSLPRSQFSTAVSTEPASNAEENTLHGEMEPLPFRSEYGTPFPFYQLAEDERGLQREASTLDRRIGTYQVLWHQSWMQPTRDSDEAPWIAVKGGEQYDDRYALEGAVQIYRSRFLHIEVDLWLSEFGLASNVNQPTIFLPNFPETDMPCDWLKDNWGEPQAPRESDRDYYGCALPPPAPEELEPTLTELLNAVVETAPAPDLYQTENSFSQFPVAESPELSITDVTSTMEAEQLSEDSDEAQLNAIGAQEQTIPDPLENTSQDFDPNSPAELDHETFPEPVERPPTVAPTSAVHFHDERRMTNENIHYLDHPRMGVLVRVLPVQVDEPDPAPEEPEGAIILPNIPSSNFEFDSEIN